METANAKPLGKNNHSFHINPHFYGSTCCQAGLNSTSVFTSWDQPLAVLISLGILPWIQQDRILFLTKHLMLLIQDISVHMLQMYLAKAAAAELAEQERNRMN